MFRNMTEAWPTPCAKVILHLKHSWVRFWLSNLDLRACEKAAETQDHTLCKTMGGRDHRIINGMPSLKLCVTVPVSLHWWEFLVSMAAQLREICIQYQKLFFQSSCLWKSGEWSGILCEFRQKLGLLIVLSTNWGRMIAIKGKTWCHGSKLI